MMHTMVRWRNNDLFKNAKFIDMPCMIPELRKQMQGQDSRYDLFRNTKQCSGQHEHGKYSKKYSNALTKCARQIEFFTAVMNDMAVPEEIYFMIDSMYPVASEIYRYKGDQTSQPGCLHMCYCNMINEPAITQHGDT